MIELGKIKSLNDIPESIRNLFAEDDGVISLDETRVRTDVDVANVQKAKEKERDLGNAAKAELAKFKAIGSTPDEITDRIAELESRGGNSTEQTEKIAALQRELRKAQGEASSFKTELETIKPDYERIKTENRQRKTGETLSDFVRGLKNVDSERLTRALKKDIMLGLIQLDESGEGLVCKDGSKLEDYAMQTAKDFGFVLGNTPGKSSAGTPHISQTARQNADNRQLTPADNDIFDEDVVDALNK